MVYSVLPPYCEKTSVGHCTPSRHIYFDIFSFSFGVNTLRRSLSPLHSPRLHKQAEPITLSERTNLQTIASGFKIDYLAKIGRRRGEVGGTPLILRHNDGTLSDWFPGQFGSSCYFDFNQTRQGIVHVCDRIHVPCAIYAQATEGILLLFTGISTVARVIVLYEVAAFSSLSLFPA